MKLRLFITCAIALIVGTLCSCSTQQVEELKAASAQATEAAQWAQGEIARLEDELVNAPPNDPVIKALEQQIAELKRLADESTAFIEQANTLIQEAPDGWALGDIAVGALAPLVPGLPGIWFLIRTIAKRRQETEALIANIEAARITGGGDGGTIALSHDIFKAANIASGIQPIIYSALGKTP